ncbi:MAG TPA: phosphoribosyl-AMP cyclohydrolase [Armatimonadetes bacterium]|nr:phosphoribosyl-AMP cyclohydrolase [Armatimonadota bacterium]
MSEARKEGGWLDAVKFGPDGLVPVVVQDVRTGRVVMVAYMDREALRRTVEEGRTVFFSRSRGEYWVKGERSGHVQLVREVRLDCDGDAVLVLVEQEVAACHEGYFSCFFRRLEGGEWKVVEEKVFEPEEVYGR